MYFEVIHCGEGILDSPKNCIETINDQLKNMSQIAYTRHHNMYKFLIQSHRRLDCLIVYISREEAFVDLSSLDLALLPVIY